MESATLKTSYVDFEKNMIHGKVYSIQHYVINVVSDLRQVGSFLRVLQFPPPIKLTAEILLKYSWNTTRWTLRNNQSIIKIFSKFSDKQSKTKQKNKNPQKPPPKKKSKGNNNETETVFLCYFTTTYKLRAFMKKNKRTNNDLDTKLYTEY